MRTMRATVVYVSTCQRIARFSFLRSNVPINVPKACQFFNFACQKAYQFFNYFSEEFFNFWIFQLWSIFAHFENIWAILENLSRETSNLNFDICKISSRKNFVNLKPLMSFSMEHVGLTVQLFGYGKIERNIYFLST